MAKLKHDATVGRLLIIDVDNPPDITAEEFMQYVKEGFVPVLMQVAVDNEMSTRPASYGYVFAPFIYTPGVGVGFLTGSAEISGSMPNFPSKEDSAADDNLQFPPDLDIG